VFRTPQVPPFAGNLVPFAFASTDSNGKCAGTDHEGEIIAGVLALRICFAAETLETCMELPVLVRISSSPPFLFLTLAVLTLLFHIGFVWVKTLRDVTWKHVDYIWLFAAVVGLLVSSGKAARFIASNQLDMQEPVVSTSYDFLRAAIKNGVTGSACWPRVRGENSPKNFDEIDESRRVICEQYKKLDAQMPDSVEPPFRPLADLGFVPITGDETYWKNETEAVRSEAFTYEKDLAKYSELVVRKHSSQWEDAYIAMGPLLLAFAVAIRITKASGEIRNAKLQGRKMPGSESTSAKGQQ